MEVGINELAGGLALLIIQTGLILANWFKGRQAKRDATTKRELELVERDRKDDELRETLTKALTKVLDDTKHDIENLRSKNEENEHRLLQKIERQEQALQSLRQMLDEKEESQRQERNYYRQTIETMRNQGQEMLEVALNAQKQYETAQQEKNDLADTNRILNAAVASQREQIVRLETSLDIVTQERDRLLQQLATLQTTQLENVQLKAEIERLNELIRQKNIEIEQLKAELQKVNPPQDNHIGALTSAGLAMEMAKESKSEVVEK